MKDVAKIIISDKNSKILVLVRGKSHPHYADHLDFPGGEVEPNEDHIQAIVREVQEEVDLILSPSKIKLLFEKKVWVKLTYILYSYQLNEITPEIKISWEHGSYIWLDKKELLSLKMPRGVDPYYKSVIKFLTHG